MARAGVRRHLRVLAKLSPRAVGGALGLFSLLLSHQVLWTALTDVAEGFPTVRLWILTDEWEPLFPTSDRPREPRTTNLTRLNVEIISPPETRLEVVQNGRRVFAERRLGHSRLDLPLRPGINYVSVRAADRLGADRSERNIPEENLEIVSVPSTPAEPVPIAYRPFRLESGIDTSFAFETSLVLAIGLPGIDSGRDERATRGDDLLGTFTVPVDSTHRWRKFVRVVEQADVVDREEVWLPGAVPGNREFAYGALQYVDGVAPLARTAAFRVDGDVLSIRATMDGRLAPLRDRVFDLAGSEFLHAIFGLCVDASPPTDDDEDEDNRRLLESMRCDAPRPPAGDWPAAGDGQSFTLTRELRLPPGQVRIGIRPTSALADTFLRLPGDTLTVEDARSDDQATVEAPSPGHRAQGNTFVWQTGSRPDQRADTAFVVINRPAAPETTPPDPAAPTADDATAAQPARPDSSPLIARIRELERQWVPQNVAPLLNSLLSALPFLYLLWLVHRHPPTFTGHAATVRAVTVAFLVLHFSIVAVSFFRATFAQPLLQVLAESTTDPVWRRGMLLLMSASFIYPFLAIGIVLLLKPVFRAVRQAARRGTRPLHKAAKAMCWCMFWLSAVAIPPSIVILLAQTDEQMTPRSLLLLAAAVGTGFLALWFLLFWLFRGVLRIPVTPRQAIGASWAMLILPSVPFAIDGANEILRRTAAIYLRIYPLMLPERTNTYVTVAIIATLGAVLLWQTGTLTMLLSQHRPSYRWWRKHRAVIMVATLFMAIPIGARNDVLFSFSALLNEIDGLLPYAMLLAALVLVYLYNPQDRFDLPVPVLHIGALVFAWYVVQVRATLLFIPVSFMAGWWLFRGWLVVRPAVVGPMPETLLGVYLDERRARARLDSLQRGLDKKFSEGELTFAAYTDRLNEGQQALAASTQALQAAAAGQALRVFESGPEATPSQNAAVAIKYGAVLSAPYQLLTLGEMVRDVPSQYPLLAFTHAFLYSVTTWLVMSAVFGYFFHTLRGRNGFEKAMCFSACVVLPTIPIRLLFGQNLIDPQQVLDMIRVVGFILLLALLAFDLRTLQKQRYGWRELMTVYGFATAAYGSTIVIAIASAVGGSDLLAKVWAWLAS
jgi:hypothetical protein